MKMIYCKRSWSAQSLPDMLAPVAKFQLKGEKMVLSIPYECLSASIRSKSPGHPPSVAALSEELLSMKGDDFVRAGGMCVVMSPGECLWIPEAHFVCEFNVSDECTISTFLQWVAMTDYNCTEESVNHSIASIKNVLANVCQPTQKGMETHYQAWVFQG